MIAVCYFHQFSFALLFYYVCLIAFISNAVARASFLIAVHCITLSLNLAAVAVVTARGLSIHGLKDVKDEKKNEN